MLRQLNVGSCVEDLGSRKRHTQQVCWECGFLTQFVADLQVTEV